MRSKQYTKYRAKASNGTTKRPNAGKAVTIHLISAQIAPDRVLRVVPECGGTDILSESTFSDKARIQTVSFPNGPSDAASGPMAEQKRGHILDGRTRMPSLYDLRSVARSVLRCDGVPNGSSNYISFQTAGGRSST